MAKRKNIDFGNRSDEPIHIRMEGRSPNPNQKPPALFGLIFMVAGSFPILLALNVIKPQPGSVHAPLWVIGAAGLAFFTAGLTIFLQGLGVRPNSALSNILGIVLLLALLTPFAWILFSQAPHSPILFIFAVPIVFIAIIAALIFLVPGEVKVIDPQTGQVKKIIRIGKTRGQLKGQNFSGNSDQEKSKNSFDTDKL